MLGQDSRPFVFLVCGSWPCILFIHRLSSSLVHLRLPKLKISNLFSKLAALGYLTVVLETLPCVDLQQRPNSSTNCAPLLQLDLARRPVLQEILHLFAVCGRTLRVSASCCMRQQLHVQHDGTLSRLPLFRRHAGIAVDSNALQWVGMDRDLARHRVFVAFVA